MVSLLTRYRRSVIGAAALQLLTLTPAAFADPVLGSLWFEFAFSTVGNPATGCHDGGDPNGPYCPGNPSGGTVVYFSDAAPFTFDLGSGGSITVTDLATGGDQFEVFDRGVSLGTTSTPLGTPHLPRCGFDPVVCGETLGISSGKFGLGPGEHSIEIVPVRARDRVDWGDYIVRGLTVPEPGSFSLLVLMLALLVFFALGARVRALISRVPSSG